MNPIDLKEKSVHGTVDFPIACYLSHWNIPYQWHPEDELIYLQDGQVNYNINGESFCLKAGDCIYCPGGLLHSMFLSDRQQVTFYAVVFKRNYLFDQIDPCNSLLKEMTSCPCYFDSCISENNQTIDIIKTLSQIMSTKDYGFELEAKYLLIAFYRSLLKKNDYKQTPVYSIQADQHIISAIAYIHEHFAEKITLETLAITTGYSTTHFENYFRRYTDMQPIKYLLLFRLKKSCELLETTDYSVTEIAEKCGFTDTSYFIRRFKEVYSISPLKYRKGK